MALVLTSEEGPADVGGSPRSLAKAAKEAAAASLADSQAADTEPLPIFSNVSLVQIHGIVAKPELNDQLGVVISFDGGPDRRYTVKVSGNMLRLREDKLKVAPEGWEASEDNDVIPALTDEERELRAKERVLANKTAAAKALAEAGKDERKLTKAIEVAKTWEIDTQEAETILNEVQKTAAAKALVDAGRDERKLTKAIEVAKTWEFDTQEAEAILNEVREAREKEQARLQEEARIRDEANIEFMKSLPHGELTPAGLLVATYSWVQVPPIATLPQGMEIWMLGGGPKCARIPESWRLQIVAEGQVDSFRIEVGQNTLVSDVLTDAAARFGWTAKDLQLRVDGKVANCEGDATVGSAELFAKKLTARKLC